MSMPRRFSLNAHWVRLKRPLVFLCLVAGRICVAQTGVPDVYQVIPSAKCVQLENRNGLLYLHNACDQKVRAYWCVDLLPVAPEAAQTATCNVMATAKDKARVEIEVNQSAALVVPVHGGNLQVHQVQAAHVAGCRVHTTELNEPYHFELAYHGGSVTTKCLQKTTLKTGQRATLAEVELLPGQLPAKIRVVDAASK